MWVERCWRCSYREKETGKTKEEVFECGEGGHARGRSEGRCSV